MLPHEELLVLTFLLVPHAQSQEMARNKACTAENCKEFLDRLVDTIYPPGREDSEQPVYDYVFNLDETQGLGGGCEKRGHNFKVLEQLDGNGNRRTPSVPIAKEFEHVTYVAVTAIKVGALADHFCCE